MSTTKYVVTEYLSMLQEHEGIQHSRPIAIFSTLIEAEKYVREMEKNKSSWRFFN